MTRVLVVVLLVAASACSNPAALRTGPTSGGPVLLDGGPGSGGENCIPFLHGQDYLLGFDTLDNSRNEPVRVTGVQLVGSKGITLEGSYITPISGHNQIGVGWSWPLPVSKLDPDARRDWKVRVDAVGEPRLDTTSGIREWGLDLHLSAVAPPASYDGIEVFYTAGNHDYVARSSASLKIESKCF